MFNMEQIQKLLDPKLVEQNAALFAESFDPTVMAPFFQQLGQGVQARALQPQQPITGVPLNGPGQPNYDFASALGTNGGMGQGMAPANPTVGPGAMPAHPAASMGPPVMSAPAPQYMPPPMPGMTPVQPPPAPQAGFSGALGIEQMAPPNPGMGYPQPGYAPEKPSAEDAKKAKDEKKVGALTVDQVKMLAAMTAPPEEKFPYAVAPGKGGDQVKLGQHSIGGARGIPGFAQIFGR